VKCGILRVTEQGVWEDVRRSFQEHVKDAGELARRTNIQIIAIFAGLLYVWVSAIEPEYRKLPTKIEILARQNVASSNTREAINRAQREFGQVGKNLSQLETTFQTSCNSVAGNDQCVRFQHQIIDSETSRIRLQSIIEQYSKLRTSQAAKIREIRDDIAKLVNFDIGLGFKFNVGFSYAAAIWLTILLLVLSRIWFQRSKFWSVVVAGLQVLGPTSRQGIERHLIDMPFWLAPTPTPTKDRIPSKALQKVVGWEGRSHLLLGLAAWVVVAAIALRVGWIGLVVSGLATKHEIQGSWVGYVVAFALASVIGLLVLLALPWSTWSRSDLPTYQPPERRKFLIGAVTIGGLALIQSATSSVFGLGWNRLLAHEKNNAFRLKKRRSPMSVVSGKPLAPGWYRHAKSKAVHVIWPGNRARSAQGLRARNLVPLAPRFEVEALEYLRPFPDWIGSKDFTAFILAVSKNRIKAGDLDYALKLLLLSARHHAEAVNIASARPLIDAAARLAKRQRSSPALRQVAGVARQLRANARPPHVAQSLEERIFAWEGIANSKA
jgi:hypothetical protein